MDIEHVRTALNMVVSLFYLYTAAQNPAEQKHVKCVASKSPERGIIQTQINELTAVLHIIIVPLTTYSREESPSGLLGRLLLVPLFMEENDEHTR